MFYQTDKELQFKADEDCYLFDILKIHEMVGSHRFTRNQVRDLRKVSVRAEFIRKDGFLNAKGVSGLASVASGLTGVHVYIKLVGINDPYNRIVAIYERRTNSGKFVRHYVVAGMEPPHQLVVWDPWSKEGSKTAKVGYIVGFRHLFAEAI